MLQVSLKLYQDWQRHCTGTIHPQSWLQVSSLPTHVPMKSATIQETFYTRNMRAGLGVLNKKWMCNITNTVPDHWAPLSSVFHQTAIQTPPFRTFSYTVDADLQREFNGLIFVKNDQGMKPGGIF